MPAALRFHGLDEIERGLSRAASELDYIVIDEVLDRKRSVGVARVAFSAEALAPYAEDDEELDLDDEPDDEDLDDGPWSIGERGHPDDEPSLAEATRDDDPAADEQRWLVRAALAWIREEVSGFLTNRPRCTFRLRLYRPKGGQALSKNFKVENPDYHPAQARSAPPAAPPAPQLPALAPPQLPALPPVEPPRPTPAVAVALDAGRQLFYLDPDTIPEARVWRALGRATEELLGTVGRTYTGIIDLQGRTVAHQAEQLDKSQRLVESLATQLLDARQVQREDEAEQRADEQQLRIREELGKTFLSELGSFGRLLATSRLGVAPELAELGDLVAASPVLDALMRAFALAHARGHRAAHDDLALLWRLLARALLDAPQGWALPLPAVGAPPGAGWIAGDGVWFLAALTLTRALGEKRQPSGPPWCAWAVPETDLDRQAVEAGAACLDMRCASAPRDDLRPLRRLAVETLWALRLAGSDLRPVPGSVSRLMHMLHTTVDNPEPLSALSLFDLDLVTMAAEVTGQPFEHVIGRLWPRWLAGYGAPWSEPPSMLLQRTWDLAPPEGWRPTHVRQTLQQAARGVCVPDRVWMAILPLVDSFEARQAADLAPEDVLLSCATWSGDDEARELLMREAWRRCPERLLAWFDVQLQLDPEHAAMARLLSTAPTGTQRPIIETVQRRLYDRRQPLPTSLDTWLLGQVRRRDNGWEDAWRLWLICGRTRPTHGDQGGPAEK